MLDCIAKAVAFKDAPDSKGRLAVATEVVHFFSIYSSYDENTFQLKRLLFLLVFSLLFLLVFFLLVLVLDTGEF